tara:strand:+ start:41 stop:571 length:531 start_codon:yes stop_codon:yes gene_type:complete
MTNVDINRLKIYRDGFLRTVDKERRGLIERRYPTQQTIPEVFEIQKQGMIYPLEGVQEAAEQLSWEKYATKSDDVLFGQNIYVPLDYELELGSGSVPYTYPAIKLLSPLPAVPAPKESHTPIILPPRILPANIFDQAEIITEPTTVTPTGNMAKYAVIGAIALGLGMWFTKRRRKR